MDWRLHLADHPIYAVHLLAGKPAQLAAWLSSDHVHFYAVDNGGFYESRQITLPTHTDLRDERWLTFLDSLRAPNHAYLPAFNGSHTEVFTSYDGRLRLYHLRGLNFILDADSHHLLLPFEGDIDAVKSVGFDRDFGTIAINDDKAKLYVFQQQIRVAEFQIEDGLPRKMLLPDAAGLIYLVADNQILSLDMAGTILYRLDTLAAIGTAACSPDGELIVTGDRDRSVIHVYDAELKALRQHDAVDLLYQATPLQLFTSLPPNGHGLDAVSIANDGTLVFALMGTICLTNVRMLNELPQPRVLF